jgi:hypothetical protein
VDKVRFSQLQPAGQPNFNPPYFSILSTRVCTNKLREAAGFLMGDRNSDGRDDTQNPVKVENGRDDWI